MLHTPPSAEKWLNLPRLQVDCAFSDCPPGPAHLPLLGGLGRNDGDGIDRYEEPARELNVGGSRSRWRRVGHVPGIDLVESREVIDVCIEIVTLTKSAIDAPAAARMAARLCSACSVCASIPSATAPVAGSIPAVPEQNTKPPATIPWL
jgi:hypothetical protein